MTIAEITRLRENYQRTKYWHKWGPYLSERQWGTVREDYSQHGSAWDYFPHDHARSRVYRWGEDGIAGISDTRCRICFSPAFWNGQDPNLKERLFGLSGVEGNHGEDVKELYFHLDNTPTHSYMKYLYKYPQNAYPYTDLRSSNKGRSKLEKEFEILETGIFDNNAYFDIFIEYAKGDVEDILIKITAHNRFHQSADLYILPTVWLRNLWSFHEIMGEYYIEKRSAELEYGSVELYQPERGHYHYYFPQPDQWLFTENETNTERLFGIPNTSPFVKDLFHHMVITGDFSLMEQRNQGTKFAPLYKKSIEAGQSVCIKIRLSNKVFLSNPLDDEFDQIFLERELECEEFFRSVCYTKDPTLFHIQKQALSGMMWNKQYYQYDINIWLKGDPGHPIPPSQRYEGRNAEWTHLHNEDILSMPDKWEFPWYATWDLAFHAITIGMVDIEWAKIQLNKVLREWYMNPRGQMPAYEWNFSDVNPPVHAWAAFEIYKKEKQTTGRKDLFFLKRIFHKLNLNFTWWVNIKDRRGNNVMEGGFLGLDNIGVFNRSEQLPGGGFLEQVDGTSWVAMFALRMLQIAIEIAVEDRSYEDMATKYFEHFILISSALNKIGDNWVGSWDEEEGFFYDLLINTETKTYRPIKVRSLVGLTPIFATAILRRQDLDQLPEFAKGIHWFFEYRKKLGNYTMLDEFNPHEDILLSLVPRDRLLRLMNTLADPEEFFGPYGIRSLSKRYEHHPYIFKTDGKQYSIGYEPGESETNLFGGNSNWRGPVWFPMNYLLLKAIREYYGYFGDSFKIPHPYRPSESITLGDLSKLIHQNLISIFTPDLNGHRPVNQQNASWYLDPYFKGLILFYEHFHADTGRGLGASHQTGWTGLVANLIRDMQESNVQE